MKRAAYIVYIGLWLAGVQAGCDNLTTITPCVTDADCGNGLYCVSRICVSEKTNTDGDTGEQVCTCGPDDACCSDGCTADEDGTPCNDDGNMCNGVNTCLAGSCVQTTQPVVCTAGDECHVPGICDRATGKCSDPVGNEGGPCNDDADACNGVSTCIQGSCVQTTPPVVCEAPDECHVPGMCDTLTGQCSHPAGNEGNVCGHGDDACGGISTCIQGSCVQTIPPVVCEARDECHLAGVCDPVTGLCSHPVGNEGGVCNDDGDMCNGVNTCVQGSCLRTVPPVTCEALDECHDAGMCDPATGQCSNPVAHEGAACNDDGDVCNGVNTCRQGFCLRTIAPVICEALDECHVPGTCDPATGQCSNPTGNDGAVCNDDDNACNGVATCIQGSCVQTTPQVVCEASDPAVNECQHPGVCDPLTGACLHPAINEGGPCNEDGDACNGRSTCMQGSCMQTTPPVICRARDDCHVAGQCDPATGRCSDPVGNEGETCNDDGNICNGVNACVGGMCRQVTAPVVCRALNECQLPGECQPATGECLNPAINEGGPCNDDGNACNGVSFCVAGSCVQAIHPMICTALDECHARGVCDPATGHCSNPVGNEGETCNDDGDLCNGVDTCAEGSCIRTTPPVTCEPLDECHARGVCDPATGRCSDPVGNEGETCNDDGDFCNGVKTCVQGSCVQTIPPESCDPVNECRLAGTCDPATGACANPATNEGGLCDHNGGACQGVMTCRQGMCTAGPTDGTVCIIDGVCYLNQQENPVNSCYFCDPDKNAADWTLRGDNDGWCAIVTDAAVTCFETADGFCPEEVFNGTTSDCLSGTCGQCGQALIGGCIEGSADCDNAPENGCETLLGSLGNCHDCGDECTFKDGMNFECSDQRQCLSTGCAEGYADCDADAENGCEGYLPDEDFNCGECSYNCSSVESQSSCENSICYNFDVYGMLPASRGDCDHYRGNGLETHLADDPLNCGECEYICPDGSTCQYGYCYSYDMGHGDCDRDPDNGNEFPLQPDDVNNCGACNYVCPTGASCTGGICHDGIRYDCERDYWLTDSRTVFLDHIIGADTQCGNCDARVDCTTLDPPQVCAPDPETPNNFICVIPPEAPPQESRTAAAPSTDRCDALMNLPGDSEDASLQLENFVHSEYGLNQSYTETLVDYGVCETLATGDTGPCGALEPLGPGARRECIVISQVYRFLTAALQLGASPKTEDLLKQYDTNAVTGMLRDILFTVQPSGKPCEAFFDTRSEAFTHCRAIIQNDASLCENLASPRRIPHCRALVDVLSNLNNAGWDSMTAFSDDYFLPRHISDFARGKIVNCRALTLDHLYRQCSKANPQAAE